VIGETDMVARAVENVQSRNLLKKSGIIGEGVQRDGGRRLAGRNDDLSGLVELAEQDVFKALQGASGHDKIEADIS